MKRFTICILPSFIFLLCSYAHGTPTNDDKAVFSSVLKHFSERRDAPTLSAGTVLIEPESVAIDPKWTFQPADIRDRNCNQLEQYRSSLVMRNETAHSLVNIITKSDRWRIATEKEANSPSFKLDSHTIKTITRFYYPAYSADLASALVMFQFTWSIHGATAFYVVKRHEAGWEVMCSDLLFYV